VAEETLVGDILSSEMVLSGKQLLSAVESKLPIDAAFWLLPPDTSSWRLVLATPAVRIEGPKSVYKKLMALLKKIQPPSELSMNNVFVIDTTDPVVGLLRSAIQTTRSTGDVRFTRNTINGVFIPDAYIYRIV
jgi:hypothetical protein